MRRLIARLPDYHGGRLACTVNLVESLPRSIQTDIKVFFRWSGERIDGSASAILDAERRVETAH